MGIFTDRYQAPCCGTINYHYLNVTKLIKYILFINSIFLFTVACLYLTPCYNIFVLSSWTLFEVYAYIILKLKLGFSSAKRVAYQKCLNNLKLFPQSMHKIYLTCFSRHVVPTCMKISAKIYLHITLCHKMQMS